MAALNTLLFLLAALAIPGLINRTRALLAGRKGIRFAQHLYDVRLLLRKGAVYSPTTTAVFRAAPSVTLGTALVAALLSGFMIIPFLMPFINQLPIVYCFSVYHSPCIFMFFLLCSLRLC